MNELYLILHKVRGEPAFDVAQKMEMDDDAWWIIPTSGHRAYPYWYEELSEVIAGNRLDIARNGPPAMPSDAPDHYSVTRDKTPLLDKLRAALKFKTKPLVPLRRL